MIKIDSLTKTYGGTTVVHDINFTARDGRVTGFLGPNGAGKSTSMRMMVGLTTPTDGTATISGRRFAELPNPGREVGVHHDHPNDPMRLVMPPSASVPLALLFYGLFWVMLGGDAATAFTAGFLAGYLAYDMVHYAVHHHVPRTAVGRRLRELHMRHHFQDDERGFGVSAPYWDRVFGTGPDRRR